MSPWIPWFISFLCLLSALNSFRTVDFSFIRQLFPSTLFTRSRRELETVYDRLQEVEEMLLAGLVPSTDQWNSLRNLPPPWGQLIYPSLMDLRASGAALVPTLKRLRQLVDHHRRLIGEAQTKSAQALLQAIFCLALVPLMGFLLYSLLPELEPHTSLWVGVCSLALFFGSLAAFWVQSIAEEARWGGLPGEFRHWVLGSLCMGERFLAFVRVGIPPDQAWLSACTELKDSLTSLVEVWGHSVWHTSLDADRTRSQPQDSGKLRDKIAYAGVSIKKSIQVSLMEGRPCLEKVENTLSALREDIRAHIEKELALLPVRSLKPLFIFVAPSLLGILACGIWLIFPQEF